MTVDRSNPHPGNWYILYRGKTRGPYSLQKLQAMRARGEFSRIHQVSHDRVSWEPASILDEVFGASPSAVHEHSTPAVTFAEPAAVARDETSAPTQEGGFVPAEFPIYESEPHRSAARSRDFRPQTAIIVLGLMVAVAVPVLYAIVPSGPSDSSAAPGSNAANAAETARSGTDAQLQGGDDAVEPVAPAGPDMAANSTQDVSEPPSRLMPPAVSDLHGGDSEQQLIQVLGYVVCGMQIRSKTGQVLDLPRSTGSCFLVTPDGYAVTNRHVVEELATGTDAELFRKLKLNPKLEVEMKAWVLFPREEYPAELIWTSDSFDLAVLKIDRPSGPYLRLSGTPDLDRGTTVFAFGFPGAARTPLSDEERSAAAQRLDDAREVGEYFTWRDRQFSETRGTVSRVIDEDTRLGRRWVQHTAEISPGNSGGPLVTEDGVVRGINTQGIQQTAGMNYALSLFQLKRELEQHIPGLVWQP